MRLPSKITSYRESVISKFSPVLSVLQESDIEIFALYKTTMKYFSSIEEFMDTLDCLFALQKIRYDEEREVLCYVI
nr:MAG TPA: hypothetical protein [Caudoviricetes sp.]